MAMSPRRIWRELALVSLALSLVLSDGAAGQEAVTQPSLAITASWLHRFTLDQLPVTVGRDDVRGSINLSSSTCTLVVRREAYFPDQPSDRTTRLDTMQMADVSRIHASGSGAAVEINTRGTRIRSVITTRRRRRDRHGEGYTDETVERLDTDSSMLEMRPDALVRVVSALQHAQRLCGSTGADPF